MTALSEVAVAAFLGNLGAEVAVGEASAGNSGALITVMRPLLSPRSQI